MKNSIDIVIPSKNETDSLIFTLNELLNFNFYNEIIVVVDSNDDPAVQICKNYQKCRLHVQNKKGYGSALTEGVKLSKSVYVAVIYADASLNPIEANLLFEKGLTSDFYFGSRYMENSSSEDDDFITYIGNFFFTKICRIFFNIKLSDILYTYVIFKREKFIDLDLSRRDTTFCIQLPYLVNLKSYSYEEFPSNERKRHSGTKKVNALIDGYKILIYIMKLKIYKKTR
tara:strand:+ start:31220 stop:31903 length:684 start_codon:yes stop_codon:yes gene_type:complete